MAASERGDTSDIRGQYHRLRRAPARAAGLQLQLLADRV
jgi:hypothetical protein